MRISADILKDMDAIVATAKNESRDMTAAEIAEFDKLKAEYDIAVAAEAEADDRAAEETAAREAALRAAHDRTPRRAVVTPPTRGVRHRAQGAPAAREFETFGEFVHAALFNQNDARLEYQDMPNRGEQRMDDGPSGGFLIPQQFRTEIYRESSGSAIVRPRARVIPPGSPPDAKISFPALDQREAVGTNNMYGGIQIGYVAGEGGLKPNTNAAFREVSLEPLEWAGVVTLTDKFLRNYVSASALIMGLFGEALTGLENAKFMFGTGSGQPLGALASGARYVVGRENPGDFTFADYTNMLGRRLLGGNYVWVITLEALPKVMRLRNLEGSPAIGDGSLLFAAGANGAPDTLGGIPIVWSQFSPALGATGDIALADFGRYFIKDGSGPFIAASEHVNFVNNKTVVKIFGNHDGQPALTEPLKLENGYRVSPFVVLG